MDAKSIREQRNVLIKEFSKEYKIEESTLTPLFLLFEKNLLVSKSKNIKLEKLLKKSLILNKQTVRDLKLLKNENEKLTELLDKSVKQTNAYKEGFAKLKNKVLQESKNIGIKVKEFIVEKFSKELTEYKKFKMGESIISDLKNKLKQYGEEFGFAKTEAIEDKLSDLQNENFFLKKQIQEINEQKALEQFAGDIAQVATKTAPIETEEEIKDQTECIEEIEEEIINSTKDEEAEEVGEDVLAKRNPEKIKPLDSDHSIDNVNKLHEEMDDDSPLEEDDEFKKHFEEMKSISYESQNNWNISNYIKMLDGNSTERPKEKHIEPYRKIMNESKTFLPPPKKGIDNKEIINSKKIINRNSNKTFERNANMPDIIKESLSLMDTYN